MDFVLQILCFPHLPVQVWLSKYMHMKICPLSDLCALHIQHLFSEQNSPDIRRNFSTEQAWSSINITKETQ